MNYKYYIADAFYDPNRPFSGNPAAVVILSDDDDINDDTKQKIAAQFNLSETVFVSRLDNLNRFLIRWFSPTDEIALCGHATMVASFVLFTEKHQYSHLIDPNAPLKYRTHFGADLEASFDGTRSITLNFPNNDPVEINAGNCAWIEEMKKAILGKEDTQDILGTQLSPNRYLQLRLAEGVDIESVRPDFEQMVKIDVGKPLVVAILTQKSDFNKTGVHFVARVFASFVGVNEDPVCGSAFTVMAPYWSKVYQNEVTGPFQVKQKSKRGGLISTKVVNDRVLITGQVKRFSIGVFTL